MARRSDSDPRFLTDRAMRLIAKRLRFLKDRVPPEKWTNKDADEVTGYLRALRGATKETEDPTLQRARELRKVPTPELKRMVEEVDDDAQG